MGIGKPSKAKKIENYNFHLYLNSSHNSIAREIRENEKYESLQNSEQMRQSGRDWYLKGRSLDIAPPTFRENKFFNEGYGEILREHIKLGKKHFEDGGTIDDIPEEYKKFKYFLEGFNYAKFFSLGEQHFKNGGTIEDIPLEYKNNSIFLKGFRSAYFFNLGVQYALDGGILKDIPLEYRNNEYFMNGFRSTRKNISGRKK